MKRRWRSWLMVALAVGLLVPALFGFGNKFREFILLYGGDEEGSFALMPILNYLLASLGFFMLFCWAVLHGMFRNIEMPKQTMLANERRLDQDDPEPPLWADEVEDHDTFYGDSSRG
jgi:hypothetical protein